MKNVLIKSILLSMCIFNISSITYADENSKDGSSELAGGYTIEGIPNDNQIDKNVTYFFLNEQPGEKDKIKVKLVNDSDEEKILEVKVTDAATNSNGLIDYTGSQKNNESMKIPLTSIVNPEEKEVKLSPKSEVETALDVRMPEKEQDGIILGGVVVSEKKNDKKDNESIALGNTYTYTIGIILTNDQHVKIYQNKSIELSKVEAKLFDGRKIVQADILNPNPYIFGEATVSGRILDESNKIIQEENREHVKIAPFSVFPFQFDWKKEKLQAGTYVFEGKVTTSDNEWNFKQKFTISDKDAKEIDDNSVFKVHIPNWISSSLLFVSVLAIGNMIFVIVRRMRGIEKS
ncbi:DUF916 and DUF3324 domain-containing protein [Enterococcus hirae]|uniref:DUF916 and DUF3324 domain-containing protein n=1 Tax=Enterococcus hirae TaxID=1354 RepID=UPI003075CD3F